MLVQPVQFAQSVQVSQLSQSTLKLQLTQLTQEVPSHAPEAENPVMHPVPPKQTAQFVQLAQFVQVSQSPQCT